MSHYFIEDTTLAKDPKTIDFIVKNHKIMVVSDKGTFSKYRVDLGTRIFINTLIALPINGDILDLGCGNGIIGISIKKVFEDNVNVSFLDINPYCVELTKKSLKLNNLDGEVYQGDGLKDVEKKFNFILLNSPISAGKDVCYRLYDEANKKLNDDGKLLIVIRKDKGALSHKKYLETIFKNVELLEKEKGYFVIESWN